MDNTFDKMFYEKGSLVAGIDESGVSDIAGPLVAACVILPRIDVDKDDLRIFEVNDSKKIPEKYRKEHARVIWEIAVGIGIGEVSADEIDYLGKRRSTILAMMRAIAACRSPFDTDGKKIMPDFLMIDGEITLPTNIAQIAIKDGDTKSLSVAAASILAKVYRDDVMQELHRSNPIYGWAKNKGAPCEKQFKGIDHNGVLVGVHRTKFWPFQPNKERRENEGMWHWRRGVWRQKTLENSLREIGTEQWIDMEVMADNSQQKHSEKGSSKPSKGSNNKPRKTPKSMQTGNPSKSELGEPTASQSSSPCSKPSERSSSNPSQRRHEAAPPSK